MITCATCGQPFDGRIYARRTDAGWEHVRCPCVVPACGRPRRALDYCHAHYKRHQKGHGVTDMTTIQPHHIEDIEWMAETGEHLDGAAQRLGVRPSTLDRHLRRVGRLDLLRALNGREVAA